MTITHQPTIAEPYIVVDVLYFDADGNDSYFNKDPYADGQEGPAVYVDSHYICSPAGELCWNTHQKTAESETKKEGWWVVDSQDNKWDGEHTYTKERTENTYTIKFWNPYKDPDNSDHYRVSMYVFLKYWEVGKTHKVSVGGQWQVNGSDGENQYKSVTTNAFTAMSSIWPKPTAQMTNYNTVALSGTLAKSYGPTTVGIYTKSATAPSGYTTDFGSSAKKQFDKGKTSFSQSESPTATPYGFDESKGCYMPVQYSCKVSFTQSYSTTNTFTLNDMIVYGWYSVYVPGFPYPKNLSYEVTDQWKKKIKVKWDAVESVTQDGTTYPRSKEGSWKIKNVTTDKYVNINDYSTKYGEIELDGYSVGDNVNLNNIHVLFIPKDMQDASEMNLSLWGSLKAKIEPSWSFTNLAAAVSDGENGGIDLSWSHNAVEDASGTNTYSLILQRSTNYNTSTQTGTWTDVDGFDKIIKDKTTVEGHFNDHKDQNANTTYHYRLKLLVMDMEVYSAIASARLGGSKIKSFTATRGNYSSMVKLQWTVKQAGTSATNFIVQRRPLGSNKESEWADIYSTSGTVTSYSYDDVTALPGSFNEYKILIWTIDDQTQQQLVDDSKTTDGFSVASGIISGNISYGTGTAVEGAKVLLKQQSVDGSLDRGMHSLKLSGYGSGIGYGAVNDGLKSLFAGDFSVQMYLKPNNQVMSADNGQYQLLFVKDVLDVKLKYNATKATYKLSGSIGGASIASSALVLSAGEWSQLSIVYDSNSKQLTAYLAKSDEAESEVVATTTSSAIWGDASADSLFIGNIKSFLSTNCYDGYIDEFRFWTKALTELEILRNYNHPLAGNEGELAIYYPLDEGINEQKIAYDFSKKSGVSNGRHATMKVPATSTEELPSEEQLNLMSYTDTNGYYEIRGVPFSGEGTSYSVIPMLGIHEFSPASRSRYVSMSTLNHSGVDFNDVSSFPVSGTVFYAGTDYPLEGANFYVDGIICSKDGEVIQTNDKGEFTISVPIGDHFITVKKEGHVFANAGRYPADPNEVGTRHTFDREIKNLEFTDETLVNFTGRVVGGNLESNKAVGFGLSNNNIGVVELVLTPKNEIPRMNVKKVVTETTYSYETNDEIMPMASATSRIASAAWRGAGADDCRKLFIRTDPASGEFSVMIPPLEYNIAPMKVVKSGLEVASSMTVELTSPLLEYSDTLYNDDGTYELYTYNTKLNKTYHSTHPVFIVKQNDKTHQEGDVNDGAFGIKSYEIEDELGKLTINDIYSFDDNGKPVYKYGGAVFEQKEIYTFDIEAYEEYVNDDAGTAIKDHVPLADLVVTIDNALSDQQPIYVEDGRTVDGIDVTGGMVAELKSNQLKLDSLGKATYTWTCGLPNITKPYTRTISITYDIESRTYPWDGSGMTGVILGSLPTGNNFVTSGPDMLNMILRDPPGSNSWAEWSSGKVTNECNSALGTFSTENEFNTTFKIGPETSTVSGSLPGMCVCSSIESKFDVEAGLRINVEAEGGYTWFSTVETTKTISTSDDPAYVGADGDVFIGTATNVIFGKARNVNFHRTEGNGNAVELKLNDVISTGLSFGTIFHYTQHYIENELLPNFELMRNGMLRTVASADDISSFVNTGKHPVYLTTLSPDDADYGAKSTYTMIAPQDGAEFQDSVLWCNNQIETWKNYLAFNERQKVSAYENRENRDSVTTCDNFSFDSGTRITKSKETEDGDGGKFTVHGEVGVHVGLTSGVLADKVGVVFNLDSETKVGYKHEFEKTTTDKTSFSYTLAESGTDDALSVDVYDYGKYSPIFRTRGGQTSAPYEGKQLTKYYQPGKHTIMEATMQIEVPQIGVDVSLLSDVPTGSAANYTLRLGNASEVNKDVTYKLFILDGTNPDGAQLSIDGQVLTEGRLINVPGGQTITKSLQLRQTQLDVLDYLGCKDDTNELYEKGIGIVFASESQPEEIADTVFISARFTPSSSPVTLALSNTIMNTQTGTNLTLTFKDFDRNYKDLKAFRLQYKRQGATDWIDIQEYVLGQPSGKQLKLPETGASVSYEMPMASYSDGEYMFRVVSASAYGSNEEVCRYSNEIALVKDMQRPTPLGQPEPADGVLSPGDELSVTFNETILKGELTKTANFKVTGVLNGAKIAHWTALSMQNTEEAAAATEASINLAGKDFSFDTWANLTAGGGTLLSHGNGAAKLTVGTDASGKLVVGIGNQTYTSTKSVPMGKWAFLTLSYKATETGGLLNASVADDANTTSLFEDQAVVSYNGNGSLSVGKNIAGAMHELLLWDEAHDLATALLNRSYTKNPSTRHLIGYWKMNEGEGKEIRDYSRSRHMTMKNATWYMNNANKAVSLDGSHYVSIDASQLPVCVDDDYALEFWMRGASQDDAQLLQMGEIALWVKADGTLQLTGKGAYGEEQVLATSAAGLTDNSWHHVALNVLRQGSAAVYVDGVRRLTTSASNVGSINTNSLIVGARRVTQQAGIYEFDRHFVGQIDEVRVWNATMNGNLLTSNRKVRLTGGEDGLVAYYPFETQTLDEGNQVQSVGSNADLTGSGLTAKMLDFFADSTPMGYTDDAPAMRQKPSETNVSFTFVASNEKVVINIDEDPATIEGCTLNFTVRDIRDENGNYSTPAVWSAFINKKQLVWAEENLDVELLQTTTSTVTATVENKGGQQQMWTLSGLPAWIEASMENGETNPLAKTDIEFTVLPSAPLGRHEVTVYLTGNDNIDIPLTLNVKVVGKVPDWAVNANDFEHSMNVIGQLNIDGVASEDEDDILAAFIGEECRGVVHPQYNERYDGYYVTMDIYGNTAGQEVTFRAYDASTGNTYPVVNWGSDKSVAFIPLSLSGSYAEPIQFNVQDLIEQQIELKAGWNWISFNVAADNMTVQELFKNIADDVLTVKNQTQYLKYENSTWGGNLTGNLSNTEMYAVQMNADRKLRVVGSRVNTVMDIKEGWNWIGYYGRQVASLTDAFADMAPVNGNILKAQRGVAYYDSYDWSGSLLIMEPGLGYQLWGVAGNQQFSYPSFALSGSRRLAPDSQQAQSTKVFTPVDFRNYPDNAIMAVKVVSGGQTLSNAELGVFVGDECRTAAVTNDEGIAYLTIPGDETCELTFKIASDNEVVDVPFTLTYETDAVFGTPLYPMVISFNETDGIWKVLSGTGNDTIYDLSGRKIANDVLSNGKLNKGLYIINGQKKAVK